MTGRDLALLLAFAAANMKVSEAARNLGIHRTTVLYRLENIHDQTGRDPRDSYDLCSLLGYTKEGTDK